MKYLLLLSLIFSATCHALETDNYLVWDKELQDASSTIDSYINLTISQVLKKNPKSCQEAVKEIGKELESKLVHDNPIENFLIKELSADELEIFPQDLKYIEQSIYRDPFRIFIPHFGLAPNIQVNGFYFGTDKLSHFASTGRIYYEQYLKARKQGLSQEAAEKKAIDWGIKDENQLHGFWASGVFSFADLESNYQGFLFYRSLCDEDRMRKPRNRAWMLVRPLSIKDYVNANWDESYLESYRLPENWEKVAPVLRLYCERRSGPIVSARMSYYQQTDAESFSMKYISELQARPSSKVPTLNSQGLSTLCL